MTGRIHSLNREGTGGSIKTEDGNNVSFDFAAVLSYDVTCLAVGQSVMFEIEGGRRTHAVDVSVRKLHRRSSTIEKREEPLALRYLGFEQKGSAREFRFERISWGEEKRWFAVTGELALFSRHRIGIQEGPALCLQVLTTRVAAGDDGRSFNHSLTDQDVLDYRAVRASTRSRSRPRHRLGAPRTD